MRKHSKPFHLRMEAGPVPESFSFHNTTGEKAYKSGNSVRNIPSLVPFRPVLMAALSTA
jgi:hypothetical protein